MSPKSPTIRARDTQRAIVTTTCFIANLHCPSCVEAVRDGLSAVQPAPEGVDVSIVAHSVIIRHSTFLSVEGIAGLFDTAGFEVHSIFQDQKAVYESPYNGKPDEYAWTWSARLERAVSRWAPSEPVENHENMHKKRIHLAQCEQCRIEQGGIRLISDQDFTPDYKAALTSATSSNIRLKDTFSAQSKSSDQQVLPKTETTGPLTVYKATLGLSGMTCGSCVSSITRVLKQLSSVQTVDVNLLTNSGVVVFEGKDSIEAITSTIEDCGFEASVEKLKSVPAAPPKPQFSKQ